MRTQPKYLYESKHRTMDYLAGNYVLYTDVYLPFLFCYCVELNAGWHKTNQEKNLALGWSAVFCYSCI